MADLFPDSPLAVSIDDQIDEVRKEINYRKHVYMRLVDKKKLTLATADKKIAIMRAVLQTLQQLKEVGVEVLK